MDAVLARGLAKDPAARWESAAEMTSALRAALVQASAPAPVEATMALPPGAPPTLPAPARRSRRSYFVAGGLAVLILVAALGLLVLTRPHPAVSVSPATVTQGGALSLVATGFRAGDTVDVYYVGSSQVKVRTVRADTQGRLALTFELPREVLPGRHLARACAGQNCAQASFTVVR